jgi:hypothetical protein
MCLPEHLTVLVVMIQMFDNGKWAISSWLRHPFHAWSFGNSPQPCTWPLASSCDRECFSIASVNNFFTTFLLLAEQLDDGPLFLCYNL